jgi:hypothetical protein
VRVAVEYKGILLANLRIDSIVWSDERAEHIRTRAARKGSSEIDIEPEWATRAALDPDRVVYLAAPSEDPRNQALVVCGFAPDVPPSGAILKVWIWSDDPEGSSTWNGGSAALAGDGAARRYYRERGTNERP